MPIIHTGSYASDYLEERALNHVFRSINFSPCPVWIALFTNPTTASYLESNDDRQEEVSGIAYQRVSASTTNISPTSTIFENPITQDTGQIQTPTRNWRVENGVAYNNFQIDFPQALGNWGEIPYFALMSGSNSTAGSKIYFYGNTTGASTVDTGNIYSFVPGTITIELSNNISHYLANKLLNYILNRIYYPSPGLGVYLALFNTLPDDDATTPEERRGVEVSGYDYVRQYIAGTNQGISGAGTGTGWSPPISGSMSNSGSIIFTTSALSDWGEIEGIALVEAFSESPGVAYTGVLYQKAFTSIIGSLVPPRILVGDGLRIPAGWLKVFFDVDWINYLE